MKRSSQYCGGRPRGNTGCCSFCFLPILIRIKSIYNELTVVVPEFVHIDEESRVRIISTSFQKKLLTENDKQKRIILNFLIDSLKLFEFTTRFYAPFVTICQSSDVEK